MSKSSTIKRSTILLFVFVVSVSLVAADLVVFAQNSNSSTTQDDQTRGGQMTSNTGTQNTNTGRTGRRRRRRGNTATTNATTNTGDMGNMNMSGDAGGNTSMQGNANTGDAAMTTTGGTGGRRRRRRGGRAAATTTEAVMTTTTPVQESEQTDLSGTYTGTLSCAGIPASGEGTLTITGNQFTFTPTAGGGTANGRVAAVTTRGYTAVAMQFGESVAPPPGGTSTPPVIISLRARRAGDRLMLSGVANTPTRDCAFSTPGTTGGGGRRRRGRRRASNTTTTTDGMGNMNMNR